MNAPLWNPASWRTRPVPQMPAYPDPAALRGAEVFLAAAPPLVDAPTCGALMRALAGAAAGESYILQGGDCAESFAEHSPARIAAIGETLGRVAAGLPGPVVMTARLAGQFAKPRSATTETRDGVSLPVYRGDSINDFAFTAAARQPDPARMLRAYEQAAATLALLSPALYTSHEALLLPYEQALTRRDEDSGTYYATSAHFLWLGARTQSPDGAHVEFLRGIANPIGIKCAPWTDADTLRRLCDALNPDNIPGRLTLIPRMGAAAIDDCLPPLIAAMRDEGRHILWCCDPMHGNTVVTASGIKTRRVADIVAEIARYVAIHRDSGTHPGGVHLELTSDAVTECVDGAGVNDNNLHDRYETRCDPRLNPAQAQRLAAELAALFPAIRTNAEKTTTPDAGR